ncbi:MAG: ABC transporter ATP-binding protein [Desulfobacterales bacterium]|jgi:putative ABC transport system ATP-binding protein
MADQRLVELEGITKIYRQADREIEVLKGISLAIDSGEFIALQGPSGSGKSTLMHILGLLDRPSKGRYLLRRQDVSALSDNALSALRNRTVGFIFQTFYLIPYVSAVENVMLPGLYSRTAARELRQRAEQILDQVGLGDRMHFRPNQLSGGQQQRVAMARALVNNPRLLLADEPTGQLDSQTSGEIMRLIARIHEQGLTVVLVTHDDGVAGYARRRIRLSDGRITSN